MLNEYRPPFVPAVLPTVSALVVCVVHHCTWTHLTSTGINLVFIPKMLWTIVHLHVGFAIPSSFECKRSFWSVFDKIPSFVFILPGCRPALLSDWSAGCQWSLQWAASSQGCCCNRGARLALPLLLSKASHPCSGPWYIHRHECTNTQAGTYTHRGRGVHTHTDYKNNNINTPVTHSAVAD